MPGPTQGRLQTSGLRCGRIYHPQPQRAVIPPLSAQSLSKQPTATAEARKLLCFSLADRSRTCPYPRIMRTTASVDRISASTLRRRCTRLTLRASAWSKDKSCWSRFRGHDCSPIFSMAEVEGKTLGVQSSLAGCNTCPLGNRPHVEFESPATEFLRYTSCFGCGRD